MRFVPVNFLIEGMILGKSLYNSLGSCLLAEDFILTYKFIKKINDIGYNGVYIKDDLSKNIEAKEIIGSTLKNKTVNAIKDTFLAIEKNQPINTRKIADIQRLVEDIVDETLENKHLMVNMVDLKVYDDYTFYHCVNVAILSVVMGVSIGLSREMLSNLCFSALMHDIGKMFIPKDVLLKTDKLLDEEFELIKTHSEKGWEHLKSQFSIPVTACIGILQHHERWDGSGYPQQITGEKTSLSGRIIAIADVYDALTSDRPNRKAIAPSEAMEYVMGGGGTLFDSELTMKFSRKVAPYPLGTCVMLSNGNAGIVIENFEDYCLRPTIKVLSENGVCIEPYIISLKNDYRNITVTSITDIFYDKD